MSAQKQKLEKLLLLVEEIGNQTGNEWFKNALVEKYTSDSVRKISQEDPILKIYEYCIKEIITGQAKDFYKDFKLTNIKNQLIEDFIEMEHNRRTNNFPSFCLCMFQQVENIVNHLAHTEEIATSVKRDWANNIITKYDRDGKPYKAKPTLGTLLSHYSKKEETLNKLRNSELSDWYFNNKFRTVLFYFTFNGLIEVNTDEFERLYNTGNYLYQIRNLNHRGGKKTEYQEKVTNEIIPFKNKFYLKFLGFLEEFVSRTNDSIAVVRVPNDKAEENPFNTNPALQELIKKMKI